MNNLIFRMIFAAAVSITALAHRASAESLPEQPSIAEHPGSASYPFTLHKETFNINGRQVDVFCPEEIKNSTTKAPVIIFGHGQAIDINGYNKTMEHVARKGFCAIFPTYDSGFFDQEWRRMAADYVSLSAQALQKISNYADSSKVVFAGHSKGAYVALVAAGLPSDKLTLKPSAVVLFAPAGYDSEYIQKMDRRIPVSIIWGEADTIIKRNAVQEIYSKLPSNQKQFILARSYSSTSPTLPADHYFVMNKRYFFGGRDGVSAFHFYGAWKWLVGAGFDLSSGGQVNNPYIYGEETGSTGLSSLKHEISRSW